MTKAGEAGKGQESACKKDFETHRSRNYTDVTYCIIMYNCCEGTICAMCIDMLHMCQVADLQRQLREPKPCSRLGLGSKHPSGPPKAEGTAQAASDELGHLHTQVEGVESTIATLRSVPPAAAPVPGQALN